MRGQGCCQNCSFCSVVPYYRMQCGKTFSRKSVPNVISEMRQIYERFGVTRFDFNDDNFTLPGRAGIRRAQVQNYYLMIGTRSLRTIFVASSLLGADMTTTMADIRIPKTVLKSAIFYLKKFVNVLR